VIRRVGSSRERWQEQIDSSLSTADTMATEDVALLRLSPSPGGLLPPGRTKVGPCHPRMTL
jgi:hypothetical protein